MATISNLNVKLTAGIGSFVSTMGKALKPIQSLGRGVASLGGKVTWLAGGLVALAAGAGMVALVKSSMESIDATAKLSDRLGITTEALTGLQHAADLSGISAEGLTGGGPRDGRAGISVAGRGGRWSAGGTDPYIVWAKLNRQRESGAA